MPIVVEIESTRNDREAGIGFIRSIIATTPDMMSLIIIAYNYLYQYETMRSGDKDLCCLLLPCSRKKKDVVF